jgi:hypothetical protein
MAVLSVKGKASVEHFPAGTDQEFVQQLDQARTPDRDVASVT